MINLELSNHLRVNSNSKIKTMKNLRKKYSVLLLLIIVSPYATAQLNTNLGQNAGNGGFYNTSIGGLAGDKITGSRNSFLGQWSGSQVTSGFDNTLLGYMSGLTLTTGDGNIFIGNETGRNVTYRSGLTFIGTKAGRSNTNGSFNTFIGYQAGYENTTGSDNHFDGYQAGYSNTTGYSNIFTGKRSGYSNTTGWGNVFMGNIAGYSNTTGLLNTFIGFQAGYENTTGLYNTFNGGNAGRSNTTGRHNTFMGTLTGELNTTGMQNTFLGRSAGSANISGSNNTFVGVSAGVNSENGWNNTYIGMVAGASNKGNNNVFIGKHAGIDETNANNKFLIQQGEINTTPLILGDFETGSVALGSNTLDNEYRLFVNGEAFATGIWLSSDKKFKKDSERINNALETINNIEGVSYQFKDSEKVKNSGIQLPKGKQYGLIAQELEAVLPDLVKENKDGYKAVNYQGLIPIVIEALKEVNANNKELKEEIEGLESQLANLKQRITSNLQSEDLEAIEQIKLYQNIPNPFGTSTSIRYELPKEMSNASIYIFDMQGAQKKVYKNLLGKQQITITSGELPSGMYMYSLIINSEIIDTKKMLLTK